MAAVFHSILRWHGSLHIFSRSCAMSALLSSPNGDRTSDWVFVCTVHARNNPGSAVYRTTTTVQRWYSTRAMRRHYRAGTLHGGDTEDIIPSYWRENNGTRKKMEPPANHTQNTNKTLATRFYTHT